MCDYPLRNPTETSTLDVPSYTATRETAASYLAKYHEEAALKGQHSFDDNIEVVNRLRYFDSSAYQSQSNNLYKLLI